jgi:hypothetical protein
MTNQCSGCKHWCEMRSLKPYIEEDRELIGECRKNAPYKPHAGTFAMWPRTFESDWCGEWSEQTEKSITEVQCESSS